MIIQCLHLIVIFGYLADMVATIPTWISMEINRDELDIAPAEGQGTKQAQKETKAELLKALDEAAAGARRHCMDHPRTTKAFSHKKAPKRTREFRSGDQVIS
jgi:hypothetical protein